MIMRTAYTMSNSTFCPSIPPYTTWGGGKIEYVIVRERHKRLVHSFEYVTQEGITNVLEICFIVDVNKL